MAKRQSGDANQDTAIQLDDRPRERMVKVWFRAYVSDVERWKRIAEEAGAASTSDWVRDGLNRLAVEHNRSGRQKK